ncbi:MAG: sugar ABC transporter permease [Synergistaceae bacterium]|nr:sugar ABC transporter permease [Synergistaceae bacterium]
MYKSRKEALLYGIPGVCLVLLFVYYPLILNFANSFYRWNAFSPTSLFVGFENYARLWSDPIIKTAFINNALYAVISVIFQCGLGLVFAAILENKMFSKFQGFFRTVYFVPAVISLTVIGILWQFVYHPMYGIVNPFLKLIGLGGLATDWLGKGSIAIYSVIFVSQWQNIGYIMLLFIVAIQKIPSEIYESAVIDGATGIQGFFYITLPLVKEMTLVTTVITVIGAFKVFSEVYVMTAGGPGHATETLATYMYRMGFRNDEMGYASAISALIFAVLLALTLVQVKISKTRVK